MKAAKSNIKTTWYGGIVPILKMIKKCGVPETIQACLGKRNYRAKFGFEDIIVSLVLRNFCGGKKLEDIKNLEKSSEIIEELGFKVPSPDTLGRVMKKLATKTVEKRSNSHHKKISYGKYNENIELNDLNIQVTKKMGLLAETDLYTLDMDATFVPTECYEAQPSYIGGKGFMPMTCFIGNLPVFVSMRGGNVNPGAESKECLENAITLLRKSKINVGKVRMDSASFSNAPLDYLNEQGIKFYVAARKVKPVMHEVRHHQHWRTNHL